MQELVFKNISDFHAYNGMSEPENSLFSVSSYSGKKANTQSCDESNEEVSLMCDFYSISFKQILSGELVYGRTKYDCTNGTLLFTAPNQKLIFKGLVFSSKAYHISFHKDFIRGTDLYGQIKKYNFFEYRVNEALHLSTKEEAQLKSLFKKYYKRQFLSRKSLNQTMLSRFTEVLNEYFEQGDLLNKGIPTLDWLAGKLEVSHRYMSDMIKAETGKTAIDQINLFLIDEAKSLLLAPNTSISETAYKLGFEYLQYFSRLFKKKTGISPKEYIETGSLN